MLSHQRPEIQRLAEDINSNTEKVLLLVEQSREFLSVRTREDYFKYINDGVDKIAVFVDADNPDPRKIYEECDRFLQNVAIETSRILGIGKKLKIDFDEVLNNIKILENKTNNLFSPEKEAVIIAENIKEFITGSVSAAISQYNNIKQLAEAIAERVEIINKIAEGYSKKIAETKEENRQKMGYGSNIYYSPVNTAPPSAPPLSILTANSIFAPSNAQYVPAPVASPPQEKQHCCVIL